MYNGPEEIAYIEQGVGYHIKMKTANGWCASGEGGGGDCSVNGGDNERLLYKLSPTFS